MCVSVCLFFGMVCCSSDALQEVIFGKGMDLLEHGGFDDRSRVDNKRNWFGNRKGGDYRDQKFTNA